MTHAGNLQFLAFNKDGRTLVTGSSGSAFRLWDGATAEPLCDSRPVLHSWSSAVVSPDDRMLATGDGSGTVRLWSMVDGKPLPRAVLPAAREAPAVAVAFSPDTQLLAVAQPAGVQLWDLATFKPLGPQVASLERLLGVTFADDGRSFFTIATDGTPRRWPVPEPDATADPERFALLLQVATGLRMDEGQALTRLSADEWQQRRGQLEEEKVRLAALPDELVWHEARARDAEQFVGPAARRHLDRLTALRPNEWLLHARRGQACVESGDLAQAVAAYDRAAERGAGAGLHDWYRHRAATLAARQKWSAAVWYLDRLSAAQPNDWRAYADRAEIYGRLGKPAEREADLEAALRRGPDREFLVRLANERAGQAQWAKADALYEQATADGRAEPTIAYLHALVRLKRGERAGYQRICGRALRELAAQAVVPPGLANNVAMMCALGPDAVAEWQGPLTLIERALAELAKGGTPSPEQQELFRQLRHSWLNTWGAVLYRAGRNEDAVARLGEAMAVGGRGQFHDWIFLAMAHHRLGHTGESRQCLEKAREERPKESGGPWWQVLETELLAAEAEALIEKGKHP
jgi:tetratricopeptide (TPR) repeat protein